ncbi:MAG TPA: TonB-dependent receptor [Ferruginibacter sp.]|nr:TonB-dependent receptor [Ferruginibacter sp.]HMP19711.1 TonB-dependent receptor [Ferruginibacter sp.]
MRSLLLSTALIYAAGTAATAQTTNTDSLKYNDLNDVTVIAVKDLDARRTSPNARLVYTSKDFERFELTTIGDYMRSLPGVVMDKGNESKDVKFRGLDKEYTQILIDGERIPDGGEKREFQVDRIPMNMVERIEIFRAPVAGLDAQGMAGTINIVLKKNVDRKTLRFNASVGKVEDNGNVYDTYIQAGTTLGKKLNLLFNGGYQTRVAPKIKFKESYKNDVLQSGDVENEQKRYKEANFAPRINWRLSDKHQVNFDPIYLYSQEDKGLNKPSYKYTTSGGNTKIDTTSETNREIKDRTGWALRSTYSFRPSAKHQFIFRPLYQVYSEVKNKNVFKYKADGITQTETNTETETKQDKEGLARLTYNYSGAAHTLSAGFEASTKDRERDKTKTKNGTPEKAGAKDRYLAGEDRLNIWLADEIRIGNRHILNPGIRGELTKVSTSSKYFNTRNVDTLVQGKYNYSTFNPSLNYLWNITDAINFRANVARTVRRPQFDQLSPFLELKKGTMADPDNIGNPELVPEISTGGDAGFEYFLGKAQKLGVIGFNAFYRNVKNVIENKIYLDEAANRYVTQQVNGGNGKVWGFELDARYIINIRRIGQFIPRMNYSLLRSEIIDAKTKQLRKFKGQPNYVYNLGLEYITTNRRFSIGANYNKVPINNEADTKNDGSYETKENTDIQRLDIFANWNVTQKLAVRLAGQNLLTNTKEVRKRVYNAAGIMQNYDIERENYSSTIMLSLQWNIR